MDRLNHSPSRIFQNFVMYPKRNEILDIRKEGRKEGKEGRKEGRTEGRKEGKKEGRKEERTKEGKDEDGRQRRRRR